MEKFAPVYNEKGDLLHFKNFPCVKLFCRISRDINESPQKNTLNVDNRMILLPKPLFKVFDIKELNKHCNLAICLDHFRPHVREGIATGVIVPTEDLLFRKQGGQKIKIKTFVLQASYQKLLSQLIKGKSLKNRTCQNDLSHAELGRLVNEAVIESSPRPSFFSPESVVNFSSNEDAETSSSNRALSSLPGPSNENDEIGDTLSELLNDANPPNASANALQCLEDFTVDEQRLTVLMSVPNFFSQVESEIKSQNILFSVSEAVKEINYFGLADVFKEQLNYHKKFKQLSDLKLALDNEVNQSTISGGINWFKELQSAKQFYRLEPLGNFYLTSVKDKVIRKKIISPDYLLEQELIQKVPESKNFLLLGLLYFTDTIYGCTVFNYSSLSVTLDKLVSRYLFNKGQKNFILFQILNGLCLLHSKGIIHGSLLMENIFVYHNEIKIGNFSNSFLEHLSSTITTPAYSFPHSGPDCFNVPLNLKKSFDVWAFGVLSAELHFNQRKCPYHKDQYLGFNQTTEMQFFTQDMIDLRIESLTISDPDVKQLLIGTLQSNPLLRSSASELSLFPIFKYICSDLF